MRGKIFRSIWLVLLVTLTISFGLTTGLLYSHFTNEQLEQLREQLAKVNDPFIDHPDIAVMDEGDHAQIYKYSLFVRGGVSDDVKARVPEGYVPTTMGDELRSNPFLDR